MNPFENSSRVRQNRRIPWTVVVDFSARYLVLQVLSPIVILGLLTRLGLLTYVNVLALDDDLKAWFGISTVFIALLGTSDFILDLFMLDMDQKPSITMHERSMYTLYPLITISMIGHLILAIVGLRLLPPVLAPFLWASIPCTAAISLKHALQLLHCALTDHRMYDPILNLPMALSEPDQSSWHGRLHAIYGTQQKANSAAIQRQQGPVHRFSIDETQVAQAPSDICKVGNPLSISRTTTSRLIPMLRRRASNQNCSSSPAPEQAEPYTHVAALQREFGVASLRPGFGGLESTWEYVLVFGLSVFLLLVLLVRAILIIVVRDMLTAASIYCSIVVMSLEITATITFDQRSRVRLSPKARKTSLIANNWPQRISKWIVLLWPALALANLGLFIGVDKNIMRFETSGDPSDWRGRKPSEPSGEALVAMFMIAFVFELALGGLYAGLDFGVDVNQ